MRLLPDETGVCSVSGKRVDGDLLRSSAVSGELALEAYLVECDVTAKRVLPSELATCSVTGKRAIASQMGVCESTGQRALHSELGTCSKSYETVLGSLLGISDFSGKPVAKTLLIRSEKPPHRFGLLEETRHCGKSGKLLLNDELGRSDVSGKAVDIALLVRSESSTLKALFDEMEICQLTGKRVLPKELETCAITSRRGLRNEMVKSNSSGRWGSRECGVELRNGDWALEDEIANCVWMNEPILKSDSGRCTLTGQVVSQRYLNRDHQLAPLADLLDGVTRRDLVEPHLYTSLKQMDSDLKNLTKISTVKSLRGVQAVCCEVPTRTWLRKRIIYYGFLIRLSNDTFEFIGSGVRGFRDEAEGFIIEQEDLHFGK